MRLVVFLPLFSALRAGVLSFASPKESSQRKGDPRVGAGQSPVPCATRLKRGLRNSGFALRQSSPFLRLSLRCSAPLMGTRETSRNEGSAQEELSSVFCRQPLEKAKTRIPRFSQDALPGPLGGAEQRRLTGGFRLALSEPQASLASRPARAEPSANTNTHKANMRQNP